MADKSRIEWTSATWNPIVGCSRTSPGCDHCYAISVAHRGLAPQHRGLTIKPEGERTDWTGQVRLVPEVLDKPLRWARPRKIFVNSLSDLFHDALSDQTIAQVFAVMSLAPQHTFQALTKRSRQMSYLLNSDEFPLLVKAERHQIELTRSTEPGPFQWPLPNVHLGVSVENDRYTFRANHLRNTPAAVRFVSAEPLLGPLPTLDLTDIDWLIVGGESGPGSRPMHPTWVRDLRDRCSDVSTGSPNQFGTSFFFKQWGDWSPEHNDNAPYGEFHAGTDWIDNCICPEGDGPLYRTGKKNTGRELDGRTWEETP